MSALLPDWVAHRALSAPDAIALETATASLTYRQVERCVQALASRLTGMGALPGRRVGILAGNSIELAVALHAVPRTAATLVPLNLRLTPAEIAWQLDHSRCQLLLTEGEASSLAAEVVRLHEVPVVDLQGAADPPQPASANGGLVDAHEPSAIHTIMYTSGTTGRPKGALLTYGNLWASAAASAYNMGVLPGDRWLACLPLFHVGGLSIVVRSAIYGTTAVIHERFDEIAVNRALREEGVSLLSVVPTMLQRMLDADTERYPATVRGVLVGGGPVSAHLLQRALDRGLPVLQTYGLTESASQVATLAPADALSHVGSAGKPLVTTQVRIDAPAGEAGEILVSGPTVTAGYLDDPEATVRAIRDGWLHTGDVGRFDDDGFLYVLDRRDDLIVTGGENVYPAEVEGALLLHPAIDGAAVVGIPDDRWGQTVGAALVVRAGFDETVLRDWLAPRLASYKVPRQIRVVDVLPVTASGKVQRRVVRVWFERKSD